MFEIAGGIILAVLFFAALRSIFYWAYDWLEAIKTIFVFAVVAGSRRCLGLAPGECAQGSFGTAANASVCTGGQTTY